jgi:hypothetical protein
VSKTFLFRIASILFVGAVLYHALAFARPDLGLGGTSWRHALFCAIDLLFAWLLLQRPRWLILAFALLTLETLASHGRHAWVLWHTQHRVDWLSLAVIPAVLSIFALLCVEALEFARTAKGKDRR